MYIIIILNYICIYLYMYINIFYNIYLYLKHTWAGTCLGIWLVLTGKEIALLLKPMVAPMKHNGIETKVQMETIKSKVPNGIAPEESLAIINMFKKR